MAKKPLNKVQKIKRRNGRILLFLLVSFLIPLLMMAAGMGIPGLAFRAP